MVQTVLYLTYILLVLPYWSGAQGSCGYGLTLDTLRTAAAVRNGCYKEPNSALTQPRFISCPWARCAQNKKI